MAVTSSSEMAKGMKKGKVMGKVNAVMEFSYAGVRTRARTLAALQSPRNLADSGKIQSSRKNHEHQLKKSYLELRNRTLEKAPARCCNVKATKVAESRLNVCSSSENSCESEAIPVKRCSGFSTGSRKIRVQAMSMVANSATNSLSSKPGSTPQIKKDQVCIDDVAPFVEGFHQDPALVEVELWQMEASSTENIMDYVSRERRETTPSSDSSGNTETWGTLGFTTSCSVHHGENDMIPRTMRLSDAPTFDELEDFFAAAEAREQKRFTERYNYDPVNDLPLSGRYEWERLLP